MDGVNRSKLRGLIAENGYNMTTLSRATGLSVETIKKLMHGGSPNYRTMKSIAQALNMTPKQAGCIFFGNDLRDA